MELLKKMRSPYMASSLAMLMLLVSCNPEINDLGKFSIDYEIYNQLKDTNLDFILPNQSINSEVNIDSFSKVIDLINMKFNSSIQLNELDLRYLNSLNKTSSLIHEEEFLNSIDKYLLSEFVNDVIIYNNLKQALDNFEINVREANLNIEEQEKYNMFANIILLLDNEINLFLNSEFSKKSNTACAEAVAAFTLATLGLARCVGKTKIAAVVLCAGAITAKILAMRNMIRACSTK